MAEYVRMNASTSKTRELRLDMKIPEAHKRPKTATPTRFEQFNNFFHIIICFQIFTDIQKGIEIYRSHFQLSIAFSLFKIRLGICLVVCLSANAPQINNVIKRPERVTFRYCIVLVE